MKPSKADDNANDDDDQTVLLKMEYKKDDVHHLASIFFAKWSLVVKTSIKAG